MSESVVKLGKYEIRHTNGTNLVAFRHGEPWRNFSGDGLILALVQRIEQLEALWVEPSDEMAQAGLAEVQRILDEWHDESPYLNIDLEGVTDDMASDMAVFVSQAMAGKLPKGGE